MTDARTALHGRVVRAAGVVAAEAWDAAEEAFAVHCGAAARLEAWRDSEHARHRRPGQDVALRHVPTIGRLCRALSRIDRYAGAPWGVVEPQPGAGVRWLVARIAAHAAQARLGLERWPLSLAYFIPIAEEEGRRLKHEGAPRVKDARIAAGKRPPRRREGRPGRGPALGRDPRLDRPRRERYSARGQ